MAYLQVSNVEIDGIANVGSGDVYVATRKLFYVSTDEIIMYKGLTGGISCPISHRDVFAAVREHRVVAEVREVHGDNHQRPVRSVLESAIPGGFEVRTKGSDLLFGWSELAGYEDGC